MRAIHKLSYNGKRINAYGKWIRFYRCDTLTELGLIHIAKNPFTKKVDNVSSHVGLSTFWYTWETFIRILKKPNFLTNSCEEKMICKKCDSVVEPEGGVDVQGCYNYCPKCWERLEE